MSQVEFRVLGPLEAVVQGGPVPLGGRRARLVLAALLLDAGRVTTVDRLAEVVWQGSPPASVRTQVAICVSNLRRALGVAGHVIETVGRGYRVRADAVRLDSCVAEDHIGRARKATSEGRPEEAVALLRAAVALWRGPVLDGLDSAVLADQALRWEELRLTAAEERAEAELALGAHPGLVADLTALVAAHPFRERLRALLMAALARSGRQADALAVYEDGRRVLAEDLGLDPGRHLRTLHAAILRDDSSVYGSPCAVEPFTGTRPAQLPAAVSVFTGRRTELRVLDDLLDGRRESDRHPPICVISGVAGVGKTGLALHWAHRVAGRFGDGQLFADLRGYDVQARPVAAEVVLERFLRALGVPGELIPRTVEERAALYRSTLEGRRVLIVLDNAASAAQVRPLLPGSAGCCVVVTARRRLEALVAVDGARALALDVLSSDEASELLSRVAGMAPGTVDPDAARRLGDLCDRLPLALRIAAAELATRAGGTMTDLADRLADERVRLDELSQDELEVRAGFALSYRDLPPDARSAFRRLSLLDAPAGYAPWMTAALLDVPMRTAERLTGQLADAQLLQPLGRDAVGQARYTCHDLIRLFALERVRAEESPQEHADARTRAFGAMLALAERARRTSESPRDDCLWVRGDAARWYLEGSVVERLLADPARWLEAERSNLVAAVARTARLESAVLCWELAAASAYLFFTRGYFDDWRNVTEEALTVCRRTNDARGQTAILFARVAFGASSRPPYGRPVEKTQPVDSWKRVMG
ncbi:AfsR/SARP family transcriptional regulator [Actinomadura sp. 6N118]|uniref:AfsR/SARP family transcriptional regulator n=1 Tax=Actinomadura sp. 6N118 TaxID=3375151 RepID=UPI0037B85123